MKKLSLLFVILFSIVLLMCSCKKNNNINNATMSCTLSIKCDTLLKNMEKLSDEKKDIVPLNGIILYENNVKFSSDDSLLDILKQELKKHKIHIDYSETTSIGTAYVKGIANIYSGDCGELSGWMIRVNGEDISVGCSEYFPKDNDVIEWLYSCDMGNDLEQSVCDARFAA